METPELVALKSLTENSPWHREENVFVHTQMVVNDYVRVTDAVRGSGAWTEGDYIGGIVCTLHDVGKPASAKWSETHQRNTFHGHEAISASKFLTMDYAKGLSHRHRIIINWMIQHHVPFGTSQHAKLVMMGRWMSSVGDDVFERVLMADQRGRISDDQDTNISHALDWIQAKMRPAPMRAPRVDVSKYSQLRNLTQLFSTPSTVTEDSRLLIVPVGPSGSGKTTLRSSLVADNPNIQVFSWDDLRTEMYGDDYLVAFAKSVDNESEFMQSARERFASLISTGEDIILDNTNVDRTRSIEYVDAALQHKYNVVFVVFNVDFDTCKARQLIRTDKVVPEESVKRQFDQFKSWTPYKPSQVLFMP